ncbi:2682_t:CDS:2 [Entrophospora sp. SA101]|nr:2682_t:CDS:2 [Entrophospora sp. SA101]
MCWMEYMNSSANLIASSSPMTGSIDKEAFSLLFARVTANFSAVITWLNEVGPNSSANLIASSSPMTGSIDKEAFSLLFARVTANFSAVITWLNEVGPVS